MMVRSWCNLTLLDAKDRVYANKPSIRKNQHSSSYGWDTAQYVSRRWKITSKESMLDSDPRGRGHLNDVVSYT